MRFTPTSPPNLAQIADVKGAIAALLTEDAVACKDRPVQRARGLPRDGCRHVDRRPGTGREAIFDGPWTCNPGAGPDHGAANRTGRQTRQYHSVSRIITTGNTDDGDSGSW